MSVDRRESNYNPMKTLGSSIYLLVVTNTCQLWPCYGLHIRWVTIPALTRLHMWLSTFPFLIRQIKMSLDSQALIIPRIIHLGDLTFLKGILRGKFILCSNMNAVGKEELIGSQPPHMFEKGRHWLTSRILVISYFLSSSLIYNSLRGHK